MTEPAAVIALRDLIAEWRCIADAAERELTHVRNPITQAVLTARIAAVCTCAEDLDALVARVEPPPQEPILAALEAAQQFLDPAVPRGPDVDGWSNTVDLVNTILAAPPSPPPQEPT